MSLILDALKKSEAERADDRPELATPSQEATATPNRRAWLGWMAAALMISVVGGVALYWIAPRLDSAPQEAPSVTDQTSLDTEAPPVANATIASPSSDGRDAAARPQRPVAAPVVPTAEPRQPNSTTTRVVQATPADTPQDRQRNAADSPGNNGRGATPRVPDAGISSTEATTEVDPVATVPRDVVARAEPQLQPQLKPQPEPEPEPEPEPAARRTTPSAALPAPRRRHVIPNAPHTQTIAPQPTPPAARSDGSPPLLAAMPWEVQNRLPALKLNVHLYTDNPEDRFVIVNMKKYKRGDRIADGPVLEAITGDGIVLSLDGNRFRLERP